MEFLKSKIKRMVLGLSLVASMMFSAVPTLAAEEVVAEETDAVVTETPNVDLATVMADISLENRAGNETWTGSGFGGAYRFTDYNLTPVKTAGQSGTIVIYGSFSGDDGYSDVSPIKLTAQIRNTSGGVKASSVTVDNRSGATTFSVSAYVSRGEQFQLYFDASSIANPPGIYRSATISYSYYFI